MLNYTGFFDSNNNYGHAQRSFVIQVPAIEDHDQRPLELNHYRIILVCEKKKYPFKTCCQNVIDEIWSNAQSISSPILGSSIFLPRAFFGRLSIGFSTVFSTYDKHKLGKIVQLRYEDRRQIS